MTVMHLRGFENAHQPGTWLCACAPIQSTLLTLDLDAVTCRACRATVYYANLRSHRLAA